MSSSFHSAASLAVVLVAAVCAACDHGAQGSETQVTKSRIPRHEASAAASAGVEPGIDPRVVFGAARNPYDGSPSAIATGRQLFTMYYCAGCHSGYAGGGMGPSLRDSLWRYGRDDVHVFATIVEGRPNGMPSFRNKLPDYQVWQLAAYVRSLSGQAPKDAAPGRNDDMQMKTPENSTQTQKPKNVAVPKSAEVSQ